MAAGDETDSSSELDEFNPLDYDDKAEEGWEDVESDSEKLSYHSLFNQRTFPSIKAMLNHDEEMYDFNLRKVRADLGLLCALLWYIRTNRELRSRLHRHRQASKLR